MLNLPGGEPLSLLCQAIDVEEFLEGMTPYD